EREPLYIHILRPGLRIKTIRGVLLFLRGIGGGLVVFSGGIFFNAKGAKVGAKGAKGCVPLTSNPSAIPPPQKNLHHQPVTHPLLTLHLQENDLIIG
ncbi:MAG TPA: hypothetical protein DDW56_16485, partial [Cyanobacteria bacterium UBA11366]|nr:hypothetical protein [Cyanobacteria bacterium UBA11366]